MSDDTGRGRFVAEALALHERYQREVVERFAICPWAKQARVSGRTRTHVVVDPVADRPELDQVVLAWAHDDCVDVGFVIVPEFEGGFDGLEAWGQDLAERMARVFLVAPFHPNAPPDAGPVRFFRQSPHPTVQLVRRTRLDEVRSRDPSHYADIFKLTLEDLRPGSVRKSAAAAVLDHNRRLLQTFGKKALARLLPKRGESPFSKG